MGLFAILDNDTAQVQARVSGSAPGINSDFKRLTVDKLIITNATASIEAGTPYGDEIVSSNFIPSQYFFQINPGYNIDPIDFTTLGSTWQDIGALDNSIAAYNEGLPVEDAYAAGNYGWLIGAAGDEHPRAYFYGSTGSADPKGEAAFLALANNVPFSPGNYANAGAAWEGLCDDWNKPTGSIATRYVNIAQETGGTVGDPETVYIVPTTPF
jgi:hypothetical protein